jgi:hypothetical protein
MRKRLITRPTLPRAVCRSIGVLQILVGLSALAGGALLVADPTGALVGMPLVLLGRTPFRSFLVPGLLLLAIVGGGNVVAGILSWTRHALAGAAAVKCGAALAIYVGVEWYAIPVTHPLQFVMFAIALLLMASGVALAWPGVRALLPRRAPEDSARILRRA